MPFFFLVTWVYPILTHGAKGLPVFYLFIYLFFLFNMKATMPFLINVGVSHPCARRLRALRG